MAISSGVPVKPRMWVKMHEILGHSLRRIALRVHGDHEDLHLFCRLRSQSLQGLRDLRQRCRAYAWAKGVAKVKQDQFPSKVTQMGDLAGMSGQCEVGRLWRGLADNAMKDVRLFACEPWRPSAQ